jgi:hypothetical protein
MFEQAVAQIIPDDRRLTLALLVLLLQAMELLDSVESPAQTQLVQDFWSILTQQKLLLLDNCRTLLKAILCLHGENTSTIDVADEFST